MSDTFIHLSLLLVIVIVLYSALHFALASHPFFEGKKKVFWILPLFLLAFCVLKLGEMIGNKMKPDEVNPNEKVVPPSDTNLKGADSNIHVINPKPTPKKPKLDSTATRQVKPKQPIAKTPNGLGKTPVKGGVSPNPIVVVPTPKPLTPTKPVSPTSPTTSPDDEPPVSKGEINTGIKKE